MKAMAGSVVHTGDIGAGNVTKLANQVIVALNIAAMSEALTLATKAGVNPDLVYQAIRGGLAGSTVLDAKAPMVIIETLNQVSVSICTLKIWRMRWIPPRRWRAAPADRRRYGNDAGVTRGWTR